MASVDVVIPNYNYAHFLPECVHSVLSQGVDDIRIIIIDNASSDDSVEVAYQLAGMDSRVEVVRHETNLGYHASFNEGIDLARADYFMILCADDVLEPGAMQNAIALLEEFSEATFVLGTELEDFAQKVARNRLQQFGAGHVTSGASFIEEFCRKIDEHVPAHAVLVRTSVQRTVGHYRPSLPLMADLEIVLRLACKGFVAELKGPLAIQRMHTTNISSAIWDDRLRDLRAREAVFRSFFSHEGSAITNAAKLHKIARRRLAETAFWSAASHFYRHRIAEGVRLYTYSLRLSPTSALLPPIRHLFRTPGAFKRLADVVLGASR